MSGQTVITRALGQDELRRTMGTGAYAELGRNNMIELSRTFGRLARRAARIRLAQSRASMPAPTGVTLRKEGDPVSLVKRPVPGPIITLRGGEGEGAWFTEESRAVLEGQVREALSRSRYLQASNVSALLHA